MPLLTAAVMCLALGMTPRWTFAQGNDRWVTDQFEVTLRTGKKIEQNILKLLPTGTKVTLLEQDDESGYSRVRTEDGTEGWVLTRYLISSPTAHQRLPQLEARLRDSEETKKDLQSRIQDLESDEKKLQIQLGKEDTSSRKLQQQLDEVRKISSGAIQLADQNKQLKGELSDAERRVAELQSENRRLARRSRLEWFAVGAGVLLLGLILGLILPRMHWQRKTKIPLP